MNKLILLFLFQLPLLAFGQLSRKGWYGGAGLGQFYYDTYWYYHSSTGEPYYDNTPEHNTSKTTLLLSLENVRFSR